MGKDRVKFIQIGYEDSDLMEGIDRQTSETIHKTYSQDDEIKLLRKALLSMGCKDKSFLTWNELAEDEIARGKDKKRKLVKKVSPVAKDHDETKFKPRYPEAPINEHEKKKREEKV